MINRFCTEEYIDKLVADLKAKIPKDKEIVIVCIGSDREIADCIAPLVGTILKQSNFKYIVYGTLHKPIHALNIKEEFKKIISYHHNSFIISIDACLGKDEDIGKIKIKDSPITPGKGVGKNLIKIGNVSILAIVHNKNSNVSLRNAGIRLSFIYDMADTIAKVLILCLNEDLDS